jgi:GMP synthase (glutamine-hydrolysing)
MQKILIIDCGSTKVPEIEKIISQLKVPFETQKLTEVYSIDDFSGVIISGAPILFTKVQHEPYLEKTKILFSKPELPILGICFGHQLMGIHFGALVSLCNESRTWEEIYFTDRFKLMPSDPKTMRFFEDHCECVTLPDQFKLVASSKTCYVEVMQHNINPWFGVQFHPEVSEAQGQELIANFIALRCET